MTDVYDGDEVADPVIEVLDDLEAEDKLTTDEVLARAVDPASPLHTHFEWDDAVAADAHRRDQARQLIARYKVVRVDRSGGEIKFRRYSHIASAGRWQRTEKVLTSDMSVELLERARRDLESWKHRYRRLGDAQRSLLEEAVGE